MIIAELSQADLAESKDLNLALLIGLAVFFGTVGGKLFQKIHIPQVVGYVVIGLFIGGSGLNLIGHNTLQTLSLFNMCALGIIGFMVGGELKRDLFQKYGKQFFIILFCEGIAAFIFVSFLTTIAAWYFTKDIHVSISLGLILGAIASATAPAATVDVLWEYKTRGPLTSTIFAIVALDDGLSLFLYGFAASIAAAFLGKAGGPMWMNILMAGYEIVGSIILGVLVGLLLSFMVKRTVESDQILILVLCSVLIVVGTSIALKFSLILTAMTLGVTVVNLVPRRRQNAFVLLGKFAPPIYVLFFVLAGAQVVLSQISGWIIVMIIVYVVGRTVGKSIGAWIGAKYSGAPEAVRKYLGLCLLSQAGVAIGLAIISSQLFEGQMGHTVIVIVMMTTFIVTVIGPIFVKIGVKKAGEIGKNITREDLLKTYKVADVMDKKNVAIHKATPVVDIIKIFGQTNTSYYPVVDDEGNLIGAITIDGIRVVLTNADISKWLVAMDIMTPVVDKVPQNLDLVQAFEKARQHDIDYLPVVASEQDDKLVGVLNIHAVNRRLKAEILETQYQADIAAGVTQG